MIIRTKYANFGKTEDLLRYMQEDVEDWIKMKKEQR